MEPHPLFIGGYGSGKTWALSAKALTLAGVNAGLPGLIISPTYRELRDVTILTFLELLEKFGIPYDHHETYYNVKLPWWKSVVWFRSADKPESLKGPTVAWAGLDEIARLDKAIWGVALSRVRHPRATMRQTFAVGTPEGYNWVYEKWEEEPQAGYPLFRAHTLENVFLDDSYAKDLRGALDPDEQKQKLEGKFAEGAHGRVYKFFDRAVHRTDKSPFGEAPSPHLPICLCCDFNISPCVWLVVQHRNGTVYVLDEIVQEDTSTPEMIEELQERKYHRHPAGLVVYGDPSGKAKTTAASRSDYELMRRAGLTRQDVARAAPLVKDRVLAMNALLSKRDKDKRPLFGVHPRCKVLIRDLERVKWQEGRAALDKGDKDLTHASDALGYFVHRMYPIRRPRPPRQRYVDYLRGGAQ